MALRLSLTIFLGIALIFSSSNVMGQSFKSEYYLVDTLDLQNFSKEDKRVLDSALTIYHNAKDDTAKLQAISVAIEGIEHDHWVKYNQLLQEQCEIHLGRKDLSKAERLSFLKLKAGALNNMGYYYNDILNDLFMAEMYYNDALKIEKEEGFEEDAAMTMLNIGSLNQIKGDHATAINIFKESLEIFKKHKNDHGLLNVYNNLGSVYVNKKDFKSAKHYYHLGLDLAKKGGNKMNIIRLYRNISSLALETNQPDSSLYYVNNGLLILKDLGAPRFETSLLQIGAEAHLAQSDTSNAWDLLNKALVLAKKSNEQARISSLHLVMGQINLNQHNLQEAIKHGDLALNSARLIEYNILIKEGLTFLRKVYTKTKNSEKIKSIDAELQLLK